MVALKSQEAFRAWWTGLPREMAAVVYARHGLRFAPYLAGTMRDAGTPYDIDIYVHVFRCLAAVMLAGVEPSSREKVIERAGPSSQKIRIYSDTVRRDSEFQKRAHRRAAERDGLDPYADPSMEIWGRHAVDGSPATQLESIIDHPFYYLSGPLSQNAPRPAIAVNSFLFSFGPIRWLDLSAVEADAKQIERGVSADALAREPLWESNGTENLQWAKMREELARAPENENWWVWTDWYEARLKGEPEPDMELEKARVLIANDVWEQGPKAVNTRIAELIRKHAGARPDGPGVAPPEIPPAGPSPLTFAFRGETIDLVTEPTALPAELDRQGTEAARQGLVEMIEDFQTHGGGSQQLQLRKVMARCKDYLGAQIDDMQVVLLGVHAGRLDAFAARADEMLMPEDAAELVALTAQLNLFLGRLPEWLDYLRGLERHAHDPQAEQELLATVVEAGRRARDAVPDLISPRAAEALDVLTEEAMPEPSPHQPDPIAEALPRRTALAAWRELVRVWSTRAVDHVTLHAAKGSGKAIESSVAGGLMGFGTYIVAKVAGLPADWAYLAGTVTFLTRMLGPSSPGERSRPDETERGGSDIADI